MGEVKADSHNWNNKMKIANWTGMFFLSMALVAGTTACKHNTMLTPIPNNGDHPQAAPPPAAPPPTTPAFTPTPGPDNGVPVTPPQAPVVKDEPIPLDNGSYTKTFETGIQDKEKFKADTIYFDFDSSVIKASEQSKLQDLAAYFKDNKKGECLIIEGNCDERGTEKYNLSLGERRALAAREYLANLGVDPQRLKTVTYGASRPVDPGHNEAAWKQNRRDDFVLVTPK
jgi:peptidoglycan-associated lipoprotein